ncbi:HEAT repeat domain-containing protein [Nocardia stercoris]|uniref:HEAT repeat domain-containing protein n=1 Tax=Nocardia stercoris TaxID=2483361 RepID=A0A3M2KVL6_9NOCA|nr:HEAT repeat domain-containing protein [Nocardia stercoris]RMI28716.1 HEAT repeat domain-containing protein [Nocardia stercoris]
MTTDGQNDEAAVLRALRTQISRIESGTESIAEAAAAARARAKEKLNEEPQQPKWSGSNYPGMPEGDDWLDNLPPRYVDGQRGFEMRLARELAAVGVRIYTVGDLQKYSGTEPESIPILVDWLRNLEQKIPGPETRHRDSVRAGLLRKLADPAVYGDQEAIAAVIAQLRRDPSIRSGLESYAAQALEVIAGPENYPEILALFDELTDDSARAALLPYLGRSKTPEAIQRAVDELAYPGTRQYAIQALILAEADDTLPLIARYADDPNEQVRDWVKTAMEQLE